MMRKTNVDENPLRGDRFSVSKKKKAGKLFKWKLFILFNLQWRSVRGDVIDSKGRPAPPPRGGAQRGRRRWPGTGVGTRAPARCPGGWAAGARDRTNKLCRKTTKLQF